MLLNFLILKKFSERGSMFTKKSIALVMKPRKVILSKLNCNSAEAFVTMSIFMYSKYSKISNTSYLPKMPRQTAKTQIRLLLKKQSDLGLPCLLF